MAYEVLNTIKDYLHTIDYNTQYRLEASYSSVEHNKNINLIEFVHKGVKKEKNNVRNFCKAQILYFI